MGLILTTWEWERCWLSNAETCLTSSKRYKGALWPVVDRKDPLTPEAVYLDLWPNKDSPDLARAPSLMLWDTEHWEQIFLRFHLFIFRERGRVGERQGEKLIGCFLHTPNGEGNWTCDLSICRTPNPPRHAGQGWEQVLRAFWTS